MTAPVHIVYGSIRNVMLGAGTCYAIETEKYWHLPIIFFVPSIYAGYQAYNNKDAIKKWIKSN